MKIDIVDEYIKEVLQATTLQESLKTYLIRKSNSERSTIIEYFNQLEAIPFIFIKRSFEKLKTSKRQLIPSTEKPSELKLKPLLTHLSTARRFKVNIQKIKAYINGRGSQQKSIIIFSDLP